MPTNDNVAVVTTAEETDMDTTEVVETPVDDDTIESPDVVETPADDASDGLDDDSDMVDTPAGPNLLAGGGENGQSIAGETELDIVQYANYALGDIELNLQQQTDSKSGEVTTTGWTVDYQVSTTDSKSGNTFTRTEQDQLTGVERIQFSDAALALDLDVDDNAGAAAALFYAAFDRIPDADSIGKLIAEADRLNPANDDAPIEAMAQAMIDYYAPNGVSDDALVGLLFRNVIGENPTAEDISGLVGLIEAGEFTQAGMFALAAEQELNLADFADLTTTGLQYTPDDSKMG